jgi:putative flippase GtrA
MIISKIIDRTFIKFILVGIINTIAGSSIMFALYNVAHLNYWLSSACNYVFTSVLSFFLNKYFTFSVRRWSAYMVIAFILTIALSYLIAYGISKPVVNYILRGSPQGIRENIALLSGMCFFTILNYIGQRLIVFKG